MLSSPASLGPERYRSRAAPNLGAMRRVFALVAAIVLVDTAFFAAIVPLLPHYVEVLDLSQTEAGMLTASYAAGTLIGAVPGGLFAARYGVRAAVLTGLSLLAVTSVAFGFGETTAVLVAARFAQGVGGAFSWAGGLAWLIGAAPAGRRGELIGSAIAAAIFGVMLGPVLGAAASELGPHWVFSAVGAVAVVLGVWATRVPPVHVRGAGIGRLFRIRGSIWAALWLVTLPALFSGAIEVLLPLRLDALGASAVGIGTIFLATAGLEAAISPSVGRASDRRGRLWPIRLGLAGATALAVLLPLAEELALLVAGTAAIVAALAMFWAPAMAMLSDASEAAGLDQGLAAALMNLSWAGGHVGGGALGGALGDAVGDGAAYGVLGLACGATLMVLLARGSGAGRALAEVDALSGEAPDVVR
jgi:MFS family permease